MLETRIFEQSLHKPFTIFFTPSTKGDFLKQKILKPHDNALAPERVKLRFTLIEKTVDQVHWTPWFVYDACFCWVDAFFSFPWWHLGHLHWWSCSRGRICRRSSPLHLWWHWMQWTLQPVDRTLLPQTAYKSISHRSYPCPCGPFSIAP